MKHKKSLYFSIVIFCIFIFLINSGAAAAAKIRLSVSASPSSLPAFYLQENENNINLDVTIHRSRNIVISRLMQGEVDAALLSTNEAAKLYNRDVKVQLLGIHNWGLFYLLSTNQEIRDWSDLKGEKIYVP